MAEIQPGWNDFIKDYVFRPEEQSETIILDAVDQRLISIEEDFTFCKVIINDKECILPRDKNAFVSDSGRAFGGSDTSGNPNFNNYELFVMIDSDFIGIFISPDAVEKYEERAPFHITIQLTTDSEIDELSPIVTKEPMTFIRYLKTTPYTRWNYSILKQLSAEEGKELTSEMITYMKETPNNMNLNVFNTIASSTTASPGGEGYVK